MKSCFNLYLLILSINIKIIFQYLTILIYLSNFISMTVESIVEGKPFRKIFLLFKNKGWHQILGNNFNTFPDYVTVDDNRRNYKKKKYILSTIFVL